ncbi:PTS sugar transporter subunit IIC [Clostridium sp. SYSU_GA19001]|uniref:PTS sugar transporter subunit IIC n=1 Tax=Clostridium caldaquaticum TaxID=2940653 RepID=UPI0020774DDE|nr:PTS sugar transporter subunit IIC [Clostridium caldaquaticum]MCM8709850.1 PTS sugar transporter subunit IIC [Clostridium caldaquaticum]
MSITQKFMDFIEEKMVPVAAAFANQRHLKAMRDGLIQTIPITILGGIILMIANPPIAANVKATNWFLSIMVAWRDWAAHWKPLLLVPYQMSFALLGLFACINIAYSLAASYKMNTLSAVMTAIISFLVTCVTVNKDGSFVVTYLDAKGMFTGILIAMLTVEVTRFLIKKNITIKMPDGVPPSVTKSFEALIPVAVNVLLIYEISLTVKNLSGLNVPAAIMKLLAPAFTAVDSAGGVFFSGLLAQILWFAGIHGASTVKTGVLQPFLNQYITANADAALNGQALPHVFTDPFWSAFMTVGGSGATLALVILMLIRSRSVQMKSIGKIAILPGLFNINEPVIFGTPMVLNPLFIVPFLLIEPINGIIAFFATKAGLISPAYIVVPWTTPGFISAFLASFDWRNTIMVLFLIVLDMALYYPFFAIYDKRLAKEEKDAQAEVDAGTQTVGAK